MVESLPGLLEMAAIIARCDICSGESGDHGRQESQQVVDGGGNERIENREQRASRRGPVAVTGDDVCGVIVISVNSSLARG